MIIDAFLFNNEIDLLKIRLSLLDKKIDKFYLIEAKETFTKKKKELFFNENKKLFTKYQNKIKHIVIESYPSHLHSAWDREYYTRKFLTKVIKKENKPNDILIFSDIDEIPNPNNLDHIISFTRNSKKKLLSILNLQVFNCYFNNHIINEIFLGNIIVKLNLINDNFDLSDARNFNNYLLSNILPPEYPDTDNRFNDIKKYIDRIKVYYNSGWHFSYIGNAKYIQNKLLSFSHTEYQKDKYLNLNTINKNLNQNVDILDRKNLIINTVYPYDFPLNFNDNFFKKFLLKKNIKKVHNDVLTSLNDWKMIIVRNIEYGFNQYKPKNKFFKNLNPFIKFKR